MTDTITSEQLAGALSDALSRVHEFDDVDHKLQAFGLDPGDLHRLLQDRWLAYCDHAGGVIYDETLQSIFVRGFVEGLLTGIQLERRHE